MRLVARVLVGALLLVFGLLLAIAEIPALWLYKQVTHYRPHGAGPDVFAAGLLL